MREALESSVEDIAIIKEDVGKAKKAKKVKALIESSKDETMDALKEITQLLKYAKLVICR